MARDYAKRRPNRRILTAGVSSSRSGKGGGSRSKNAGVLKHLPYLLAGVVLGLVIAGFFYIKMQPMQVAHQDVTEEEEAPPPKTVKAKKTKVAHRKKVETATAHANAQPRYDFYTMLAKNKNQQDDFEEEPYDEKDGDEGGEEFAQAKPKINTAEKASQTNNEPEPAKKVTTAAGKYVLQVASLKKHEDADRLKARLTLEGYDVFVGKQKVNNTLYYRVYIGPYRTAENARVQQKRLKQCHISSFLVTV